MCNCLLCRIARAVKTGKLHEPFRAADVKKACPGFRDGTYSGTLSGNRKGNPGGNPVYFVRVAPGRYRLLKKAKQDTSRLA